MCVRDSFRDIYVDRVTSIPFQALDKCQFLAGTPVDIVKWLDFEGKYCAGTCMKQLRDKNESCSYALRQQTFGVDSCNSCSMGEAMGT